MRSRQFLLAVLSAMILVAPLGQATAATPSSDYCKKAYKDLRQKPKFRAMALSTDGKICHSVWGAGSQAAADRQAVTGCQANGERTCSIVRR